MNILCDEEFVNKLVPILEHSKEEVLDLLKSKCSAVLKELRNIIFAEHITKLPQFGGREMYARKKDELLVEDIFTFAFSIRNNLPIKKLSTTFFYITCNAAFNAFSPL